MAVANAQSPRTFFIDLKSTVLDAANLVRSELYRPHSRH